MAAPAIPPSPDRSSARIALERLKRLRPTYSLPTCMATPPTVTVGGSGVASTINGNATTAPGITVSDSRLTFPGTDFVTSGSGTTLQGGGQNVTQTSRISNVLRVRFMTDAPKFDFGAVCGNNMRFMMLVDGQYAAVANGQGRPAGPILTLPGDGLRRYVKVDFGSDVSTLSLIAMANFNFTGAGGTGYTLGDVLTVVGGTFTTAATLQVTSVSAGAVQFLSVLNPGVYTVAPTGTLATTGGTGTGCTVAPGDFWEATHTTRKMRKIELIFNASSSLFGFNVGSQDTFVKWGVAGPRILVAGGSIVADGNVNFPGGQYSHQIAQYLGCDDNYISGASGSGYLVSAGGSGTLRARLPRDITNYSPDLIVIATGYNDNAQNAAALQQEVTDFWTACYAGNPSAFFVCFNANRGTSPTTPDSTHTDAIKNGFAGAAIPASRAAFVDNIAENWQSGTGKPLGPTGVGNAEFYEGNPPHPAQVGHDFLGVLYAQRIHEAIQGFSV